MIAFSSLFREVQPTRIDTSSTCTSLIEKKMALLKWREKLFNLFQSLTHTNSHKAPQVVFEFTDHDQFIWQICFIQKSEKTIISWYSERKHTRSKIIPSHEGLLTNLIPLFFENLVWNIQRQQSPCLVRCIFIFWNTQSTVNKIVTREKLLTRENAISFFQTLVS